MERQRELPLVASRQDQAAFGLVAPGLLAAPAGIVGLGETLLFFIGGFIRALAQRGKLPRKVAELATEPAARQREYRAHVRQERGDYGPFVALVASAYLWAALAGALLLLNGVLSLFGATALVAPDAIRHSLALGFIALLICGIAPRMIPGFSGGRIRSARLVWATLWLGDLAALLRVGSLLIAPALAGSATGSAVANALFGLSGGRWAWDWRRACWSTSGLRCWRR